MMEELTQDTDSEIQFDNDKVSEEDQERWGKFVVGFHGISIFARKALNVLLTMEKQDPKRVKVYYAAMRGREWMYKYQFADRKFQHKLWKDGVCQRDDYWRAVIEAVELAQLAKDIKNDFREDMEYFTEPIPDSKIKYQSPTTQAIYMEVA
jgi:hypothetical protein